MKKDLLKSFPVPAGKTCRTLCAILVLNAFAAHDTFAASGNWQAVVTDGNWSTVANWTAQPGATTGLTNADTATFNALSNFQTITIDAGRNVKSLAFTTAAGSYTIGGAGANLGNALLLSTGGNITLNANVAGSNIVETINAPIVLEPATGTGALAYTFTNNSTNATDVLNFAGNISLGTTTALNNVLTLTGVASNGASTISGIISNGGVGQQLGITVSSGNWTLSGANTYTGTTILTNGILNVGSSSSGVSTGPLGTGQIEFTTGTLEAVNGAQTINNSMRSNGDGNFGTIAGSQNLTLSGSENYQNQAGGFNITNTGLTTFSGVINLKPGAGSFEIEGAGNVVVSGSIIGAGGSIMRYQGTGTMSLSGSNTYTNASQFALGTTVLDASTNTTASMGATAISVSTGTAFSGTSGNATLLVNGNYKIGNAGAASLTINGGDGISTG